MNESPNDQTFDWKQQPEADLMYRQLVDDFCEACDFADILRDQMLTQTGTRSIDWVDHIAIGQSTQLNGESFESQLVEFGYAFDAENEHGRWYTHDGGLFVPICIASSEVRRLVVRVERVDDFLAAHRIYDVAIQGCLLYTSPSPRDS